MPGIAGWVSLESSFDRDLLNRMLSRMTYSEKQTVEEKKAGMVALGRADFPYFNPSPQPFSGEGLLSVFQGRIIRGDSSGKAKAELDNCAVAAAKYLEHRLDFPNHMNGSFSTVLWDKKNEQLIMANDRFGRYPIYYALCGKGFLFASELKALLCEETLSRELNERSIADFLRFGYMLDNETHFRQIKLLPYANVLSYGSDGLSISRYWEYRYAELTQEANETLREELNEKLDRAVGDSTSFGGRIGLLLSGGLDSRNMVVRTPKSRDVSCLTFGRKRCLDRQIAEVVCTKLGLQHTFTELDEEFLGKYARECAHILDGMSYALSSQACALLDIVKDFDYVLDGTSADMIFGSFLDKGVMGSKDLVQLREHLLDRHSIFSERELQELLATPFLERVKGEIGRSFEEAFRRSSALYRDHANIADHFNFTQRQRRFMINGSLILRTQTEVVNPFFDYALIDLMLRIPPRMRVHESLYVKASAESLGTLSNVAWQKTGLPLSSPEYLVGAMSNLRKGFTAIKRVIEVLSRGRVSIRQPWHMMDYSAAVRSSETFVRDTLLASRAAKRNILNLDYVKQIIDSHMEGRARNTSKIAVLLALELWFQEIYDRLSSPKTGLGASDDSRRYKASSA